jgi:hypothetical protein
MKTYPKITEELLKDRVRNRLVPLPADGTIPIRDF